MPYLLILALIILVPLLYVMYKSIGSENKKKSDSVSSAVVHATKTQYVSPDWVRDAVLYQINTRVFSTEGTFKAVESQLQRIKDLGVDVLWLMPIFPISEKNRKIEPENPNEAHGSPYAASDFLKIHRAFGTETDLHDLIKAIHALDLKVVLDFVPNHTGWDGDWIENHPEWYVRKDGVIQPVTSDQGEVWADIAQLDLTNTEMREAWMQVHEYWLREFNFDGFREDCAWAIPKDYWSELRFRLDKIKPVFMLAEDEVHGREQFEVCFEANYGWGTHHFMKQIAKGEPATVLNKHTEEYKQNHGTLGWQMNFTQNHDENTWHGTETDLFGDGADCFTALCFVIEGMPLIYNGQEVASQKRLNFFHNDDIDWSGASRADFFRKLSDLKHNERALWNGTYGAPLEKIENSTEAQVYSFRRRYYKDGFHSNVVCIFNLTDKPADTILALGNRAEQLTDYLTHQEMTIDSKETLHLKPFDYKILLG